MRNIKITIEDKEQGIIYLYSYVGNTKELTTEQNGVIINRITGNPAQREMRRLLVGDPVY